MEKLFTPISIGVGLAAGQIARRIFTRVWGEIRDEEPPNPEHREIYMGTLVVALIVEGAIARLVRGLVDHELRRAWERGTGTWPGDIEPDPE